MGQETNFSSVHLHKLQFIDCERNSAHNMCAINWIYPGDGWNCGAAGQIRVAREFVKTCIVYSYKLLEAHALVRPDLGARCVLVLRVGGAVTRYWLRPCMLLFSSGLPIFIPPSMFYISIVEFPGYPSLKTCDHVQGIG